MSENSTLHVRIDAELKRGLEELAERKNFELEELVEQMIRETLFRNSKEFADPTHPRTIRYRAVEASRLQAIRGELISQEEVERFVDGYRLRAEDPDSPREP